MSTIGPTINVDVDPWKSKLPIPRIAIPVFWQGWRSDTVALYKAGWQLAVEKRDDFASLSRIYKINAVLHCREQDFSLMGAVRLDHTSLQDSILRAGVSPLDYINCIELVVNEHQNPTTILQVHSPENPFMSVEPTVSFDAAFRSYKTFDIRDIFTPEIITPQDVIVNPNNVPEILDMIKKAQLPEQKEIFERRKLREKRKPNSQENPLQQQARVLAFR